MNLVLPLTFGVREVASVPRDNAGHGSCMVGTILWIIGVSLLRESGETDDVTGRSWLDPASKKNNNAPRYLGDSKLCLAHQAYSPPRQKLRKRWFFELSWVTMIAPTSI